MFCVVVIVVVVVVVVVVVAVAVVVAVTVVVTAIAAAIAIVRAIVFRAAPDFPLSISSHPPSHPHLIPISSPQGSTRHA